MNLESACTSQEERVVAGLSARGGRGEEVCALASKHQAGTRARGWSDPKRGGDQGARLVRSEAWQTLAPSMLMLSLLRTSTEVSLGLALCLGIGGRVEWQPRWR